MKKKSMSGVLVLLVFAAFMVSVLLVLLYSLLPVKALMPHSDYVLVRRVKFLLIAAAP